MAFLTTFVGEIIHMGIVLLLTKPFSAAVEVVEAISLPMVLLNPVGAALLMAVLLDRQRDEDRVAAASSARGPEGGRARPWSPPGASGRPWPPSSPPSCRRRPAWARWRVTDTERILGWAGLGGDHHRPGRPIASPYTKQAIATNTVVFADGIRQAYDCTVSPACPLSSVLIVPLQVDGDGDRHRAALRAARPRFLNMNRTLGEGLGALLSSQLLLARYQEQKNLLVLAELKLARAQVNPHFLFNSLNTIIAILRRDADRSRELLNHLSNFFRKNLKRSSDVSTLDEELEHVRAYLEIEKARFEERLVVEIDVDPTLLQVQLPTFTLQPLRRERHQARALGDAGRGARSPSGRAAGRRGAGRGGGQRRHLARSRPAAAGLGMQIVDKRVKNLYGKRLRALGRPAPPASSPA